MNPRDLNALKPHEARRPFFRRHRFALCFFAYVVLYNFIVTNHLQLWQVTKITYPYHLVDYATLGFRSNLLPGSLFYGLFGEHGTQTVATVYETVLLLLFFFGLAVLLERFILSVAPPLRSAAFALLLFYLSGAYTFAVFTDELGMLDVYWLFFSLLFFFFVHRKGLRFLIPLLFVLSMLVHFSAVLNYLLLFSILLLYKIATQEEKRARRIYGIILLLSVGVTGLLFVYFLLFHESVLPLSMEEFNQMLEARGSTYYTYYDYSFYNVFYGRDVVAPEIFSVESPFLRTVEMILAKAWFTIDSVYKENLRFLLLLLGATAALLAPVLWLVYKTLSRLFRRSRGNACKRLCILLMMIQFPFTAVLGCLFSPDITRWFTHAFLVFFSMFLFVLYHEEEARSEVLEQIQALHRCVPAMVYGLAWFSVTLWPYS